MISSFQPIINENCKIIILGSMPGVESLKKNQYYAFNRNQFWPIIYELFNEKLNDNYDEKVEFLLSNNIALWDVLSKCEREGSLDSKIRNERSNDFNSFFNKNPNIKYIFFNGTTSEKLFKKHIGLNIPNIREYILLPSTSPANTIKKKDKLSKWSVIIEKLNAL